MKTRPRLNLLAACLLALPAAPGVLGAQAATETETESKTATFELTVRNIMRGPELVGTAPSRLRWSPDARWLYFAWKPPQEESAGLYRVSGRGGEPERLAADAALEAEAMLDGVTSDDRRWTAYERDGELTLLDVRSERRRRLVSSQARLSSVQIAKDGSAVYFVSEDNLFRVNIADGSVTQLTDIRHGEAPKDEEPEGQRKVLQEEQRELFDVFEEDSLRRAHAWPPPPDTAKVDTPQVFYVKEGERFQGYQVSPDGMRMTLTLTSEAKESRRAWVSDYVTRDGYTEQAPRKRTLVGDEQPTGKLGIMDLTTGEVTWADGGQDEDRRVDLRFRGWSEDGRRILAVAVAYDYHDRWILAIDAVSGESTVIDELHDDAWIGGPSWDAAGWIGQDHVWFISEESGFAHLYRRAVGGGETTTLTSGPWEVIGVELSHDDEEFYLVTSEASPHERHLYKMSSSGGVRVNTTTAGTLNGGGGRTVGSAIVSPDGKRVATLYAASNRPPELYLQDNRAGAKARQITESTTTEFRAREWLVPEIVYIPARDGADVPARLYRPLSPNGAAVIFVHGAGYLQNVHRWWSVYFREYMFHNLLVERGYTVLDIDYRGSAGYGRDWRTAIRKHMGGLDLSDQVDGTLFLVDSLNVDRQRIGVYGGSYGGFITLMAMFTEPGVFAAGAALRPVTDWAYYNHRYTSRILGLPQDDVEAYRLSSPIYHAEGLEGALLIAHGMIDQNVHFQEVVRLSQRLIELGKENWEVAFYPKENHGFVHASSWSDEYSRILELFESNLLDSERRLETSGGSRN